MTHSGRGVRAAQLGLVTNAVLIVVKLVAGLLGNAYALVADAIESTGDLLSSVIVWRGLSLAGRGPDEEYPFGYGRAESLAALAVAVMLVGAAFAIGIAAVREIRTPHHLPAAWTLVVLIVVIVVKTMLARRVHAVGETLDSHALRADAWHHWSDSLTSAAALVGIGIGVIGGPGFEAADDWAALVAAAIILYNGARIIRPTLHDLMDRRPDPGISEAIRRAAGQVPAVEAVEKLLVRKAGPNLYVEIHVQTDPAMPLLDAHILSGRVKAAIRATLPRAEGIIVHMEPYLSGRGVE